MIRTIRAGRSLSYGFTIRCQYAFDGVLYWERKAIDYAGKTPGKWSAWSHSTKEAHDACPHIREANVRLPDARGGK